jgi:outer membrane immunogenic protein
VRFNLAGILAVTIVAAAQPALAADFPASAPPAATWSGCYVGGNLGGAWSHTSVNDEVSGSPIAALDASAIAGGAQIGCDYQFARNWVLGVQGMVDATGLQANTTSVLLGPLVLRGVIPWVATLTARLGYAASPDLLVYGKAGGAWAHTDSSLLLNGAVFDAASFDQAGWTVGAGAEWRFKRNWSVFAEYNYIGLADKVVSYPNSSNIGNVQQSVHLGLIGLNMRFGGAY